MADETKLLHLSSSPHIRDAQTVPAIMRDVIIALLPALGAAIYFFGLRALAITAVAVISAMLTEYVITRYMLKRSSTLGDYSAAITGILLAFNLPVSIPLYLVVIGAVFSIGVAKWAFGGLGCNFINPALAGRAFLLSASMATMTGAAFRNGSLPFSKVPEQLSGLPVETAQQIAANLQIPVDAISQATPLQAMKVITAEGIHKIDILSLQDSFLNLFWGNIGGVIGETSAAMLLLGAAYLLWRRVIGFGIPLMYIGVTFLLFWLFDGLPHGPLLSGAALTLPVFHILSGGLILGAFFMATDMVTCPITLKGQLIFATGCGVLTYLIRKFGGYPEGVSYAILLMNLLTPLIDRYIRPTVYGTKVGKA